MSKIELIEFVAAETGMSKAEAARAVNAVIAGIEKGIKEDKKVSLIGFGTFTNKVRPGRSGINPLTKEPMTIAAKNVVAFKAGAKLKASINL